MEPERTVVELIRCYEEPLRQLVIFQIFEE